MPTLTCFRLRPEHDGSDVAFETFLAKDTPVALSESISSRTFDAAVFVAPVAERPPSWAAFLSAAFGDVQIASGVHPSAILFIRTVATRSDDAATFAFAFGPAGRFMLDPAVFVRGYGLKTALNLIYPSNARSAPRLRSVDSKRRDTSVLRSRVQASEQVDFEAFDVSQLRDVLDKAVGQPYESKWGQRVQGGDALVLTLPAAVADLGKLCRDIERASRRKDYRAKFAWIDNIQPVDDPILKQAIEAEIVNCLRAKKLDGLALAPPEILDWGRVSGFRYHFDRRRAGGSVYHPDIRVADYVSGLDRAGYLSTVDVDSLRRFWIYAHEGDEEVLAKWSAWRCLVAEISVAGETYILDEGELFRVSSDYLTTLEQFLQSVPAASCALPATTVSEAEDAYNKGAAKSKDLLLMDKQNVITIPGKTTAIEVCDLLSSARHLIHVKRHLSSSTLSHLFAQGVVSAELLQTNPAFLAQVQAKVAATVKGKAGFAPLLSGGVDPSDWKIVYAVAAEWKGVGLDQLPFFSKVNLREAYNNLTSRGYVVEFARIQAGRAVGKGRP